MHSAAATLDARTVARLRHEESLVELQPRRVSFLVGSRVTPLRNKRKRTTHTGNHIPATMATDWISPSPRAPPTSCHATVLPCETFLRATPWSSVFNITRSVAQEMACAHDSIASTIASSSKSSHGLTTASEPRHKPRINCCSCQFCCLWPSLNCLVGSIILGPSEGIQSNDHR